MDYPTNLYDYLFIFNTSQSDYDSYNEIIDKFNRKENIIMIWSKCDNEFEYHFFNSLIRSKLGYSFITRNKLTTYQISAKSINNITKPFEYIANKYK